MVKNRYKVLILFYLLFIFPLRAENVKGLWVVRHNMSSPEKIDSVFQLSGRLAITDLFLQVRGRGDAYYQSTIEPVIPEIKQEQFDPLAYAVQLGRQSGIRVHAWVNVFYIWSADSLPKDSTHNVFNLQKHISKPINGIDILAEWPHSKKLLNIEGVYLSPTSPSVKNHLILVIKELVSNYQLDGIHLDYIRYPGPNYDINEHALKAFKKKHIINPVEFLLTPVQFSQKYSMVGYQVFYGMWQNFLMNSLTDFVHHINKTIKSTHPHIILSAAVKPDIVRAHWDFYQEWDRWVNEGIVDWAIPMNYSPDYKTFSERIEKILQAIPNFKGPIGIALYNQSEEKIIRKIALVEALEKTGFVLFSYDQLKKQNRVQMFIRKE